MTERKMEKLTRLVQGKTLLREAPTLKDIILQMYGFDIDRIRHFHNMA